MEESLTENKDTHLYPVGVNVDAMETLPFNMGGGDPCGCIFETSSEVDTPASPTHGVEALADSNHDGTHAVGVDTVPSPNHGDDGILKKRIRNLVRRLMVSSLLWTSLPSQTNPSLLHRLQCLQPAQQRMWSESRRMEMMGLGLWHQWMQWFLMVMSVSIRTSTRTYSNLSEQNMFKFIGDHIHFEFSI